MSDTASDIVVGGVLLGVPVLYADLQLVALLR
jgi:hypothetical protein